MSQRCDHARSKTPKSTTSIMEPAKSLLTHSSLPSKAIRADKSTTYSSMLQHSHGPENSKKELLTPPHSLVVTNLS